MFETSTSSTFRRIGKEIDSLVDEIFMGFNNVSVHKAKLSIDKDTNEYCVIIPALGFKKEDIKIEVVNKRMTVKGEIKDESKKLFNEHINYSINQDGIDSNTVIAKLEDGILTIKFKLKDENYKKITIE